MQLQILPLLLVSPRLQHLLPLWFPQQRITAETATASPVLISSIRSFSHNHAPLPVQHPTFSKITLSNFKLLWSKNTSKKQMQPLDETIIIWRAFPHPHTPSLTFLIPQGEVLYGFIKWDLIFWSWFWLQLKLTQLVDESSKPDWYWQAETSVVRSRATQPFVPD